MATFHGNWSEQSAAYQREWQRAQDEMRRAQEAQRLEMERQKREAAGDGGLIIEGEYVDVTDQKRLSSKVTETPK